MSEALLTREDIALLEKAAKVSRVKLRNWMEGQCAHYPDIFSRKRWHCSSCMLDLLVAVQ